MTGTNLISVSLFNKLTEKTNDLKISDCTFEVIKLDSNEKLDWVCVKSISSDQRRGRINWDSRNIDKGTYKFWIQVKYKDITSKIDHIFELNLSSPDTTKIRISFPADNHYAVKAGQGYEIPNKISFNVQSLQPTNLTWTIEEIIGPNSLNHTKIQCDWISIDNEGKITILESSSKNQKQANNNYRFRVSATNGTDMSTASNPIYLQVSVDWKMNYVPKCYLTYSGTTITGFNSWYLENASSFIFDTLCIPSGVTAIANNAFDGISKMPAEITSLEFYDDSLNDDTSISIGDLSFANNSFLNTVRIPRTVTSIGNQAFARTDLKDINLDTANPNFHYSSNLVNGEEKNECRAIYRTNEDFGTGSIVGNLICGCPCIPLHISAVEEKAFAECFEITGVILLNTFYSVGDYAFYNCENLSYICWRDVTSTDNLKVSSHTFAKISPNGLMVAGNKYCTCDDIYYYLVLNSSFPPSHWDYQNE